jgi:trehalose 6-phosphate synthase
MNGEILSQSEMLDFLSKVPLFAVVSNRGGYKYVRKKGQSEIYETLNVGGLPTALDSVLSETRGTWIAWADGNADREYGRKFREKYRETHGKELPEDTTMVPMESETYYAKNIWLKPGDIEDYYHGMSNRVIWPWFHKLFGVSPAIGRTDYWTAYKRVNRNFADAIPNIDRSIIFVNDYHLMLLPRLIKERNPNTVVPFFLHCPFPPPQRYVYFPEEIRFGILNGLIHSDVLGFQTEGDKENFIDTVEYTMGKREKIGFNRDRDEIYTQGRRVIVDYFPISIDFDAFEQLAINAKPITDERLKDRKVVLGVERFDYTKGLRQKIGAIGKFFRRYPQLKGEVVFVQIASPSRGEIKEYKIHRREVLQDSDELNNDRKIITDDWRPFILIEEYHTHKELAAYYKNAYACWVNSLHDGQNLVAKEYPACQVMNDGSDGDGVLILSEHAGAHDELGKYALSVNPYDEKKTARTLLEAVRMPHVERKKRMSAMRQQVRENNVDLWTRKIMANTKRLYDEQFHH